jgi:L-lysine 6-transaminase
MQVIETPQTVAPTQVHATLRKHMLADGMEMVLDLARSQGVYLYDALSGRRLLDFFGFFATNALGMNHPKLAGDAAFMQRLTEAALNNITNSDVYTPHMARFVQTFSRVGIPDYLKYAFFVAGGTLAVENALKTAFDWKVRKNFHKGYRREVGHQAMHFDQAFHGRSGYAISMTNTADPRKTAHFPKFDWPRVSNPMIHFPLTEERVEDLIRREHLALAQAKQFFLERKDDIACIIIEPIQGEGGDNHFRAEVLNALRDLAHENDALFICDEVQAGVGITGAFWAHQAIGVQPDIMAFGKKTQVCGLLAGPKLDEIDDHVFRIASRINSTWGGNLVDMVRFDRILEVIEEDHLLDHVQHAGAHLQQRLHALAAEIPHVTNVRGRGLMCALDLPCAGFRDRVRKVAYQHGLVLLGCGRRSLRFRSPLTITSAEIDEGMEMLAAAIRQTAAEGAPHHER